MGRFCGNCGNPIGGYEKFCGKCGARVNAAEPAEAAGGPKAEAPEFPGTSAAASPKAAASAGTEKIRETIIPAVRKLEQSNMPVEKILRIAAAAVSALMILSTFLPYIEVMGQTASFWDSGADSVIVAGLGILGIVFAVLSKKTPLLVVGVLSFLLGIYERHSMKSVYDSTWIFASYIIKKSGYYLLAATSVLMLIVCLLYFFRDHIEAAVSKSLK